MPSPLSLDRTNHPRGFTLIELMVAVAAGFFVAIATFALAKQASRFFQQEARISGAQLSTVLGFNRMRADIARAAFMSSPNIRLHKPHVCSTVSAPAGLASLSSVVVKAATPSTAQDTVNNLQPDQLVLSGSYSSAELFPVRNIAATGTAGGSVIYLETTSAPVARTGIANLASVFMAGRAVRIVDDRGNEEYGVIHDYDSSDLTQPKINLEVIPALPFLETNGICGITGNSNVSTVNVVNWIRYSLTNVRSLALTQYAPLYAASATAPEEVNRHELTREELDATGNPMAGTLEILAEYAVDLRFGLTVTTSYNADGSPNLLELPVGDARVHDDYAFDTTTKPTTPGPERVRAVRARLVVRSREGDRLQTIAPSASAVGNIYRFQLPGSSLFARTRTLTATVQLPNQASIRW